MKNASGILVSPMGIPTSVVIRMEKIIYPGTRICLVMSISRNPIRANSTEGELRSPKARLFLPSRAIISPAFLHPSSAMNRPTPELTACLRLAGMAFTTASLRPI